MSTDLFILIPYFNPFEFKTRVLNLSSTVQNLKKLNLNFAIVQAYMKGCQPKSFEGVNCINFETDSVLWHKERLVNLGVSYVDRKFSKIAWIDSDVLISDGEWANKVSKILEEVFVAQLFDEIQEQTIENAEHILLARKSSISALIAGSPLHQTAPGYAWAARREILEKVGLYDRLIVGGGAVAWLYALLMKRGSRFLWARAALSHPVFFNMGKEVSNDYMQWAENLAQYVGDKVGCVSSMLTTSWHEDLFNIERRAKIYNYLNPKLSLSLDQSGCWQWVSGSDAIKEEVTEMLIRREEDG